MQLINDRRLAASSLVVATLTVLILGMIAGLAILSVNARVRTPHRSGAWNEALTTAEAGVDMTVADLSSLLPDVTVASQGGFTVSPPSIPSNVISALSIDSNGVGLASGLSVSYQAMPLIHGGEGGDRQTATLTISTVPLSTVLGSAVSIGQGILSNPLALLSNGSNLNFLEITSKGTADLTKNRAADVDSKDSQLRHVTLIWDPTTGSAVTQPSVTREVDVLLRPMLPFQYAVATSGSMSLSSASSQVDSFNSLLPLFSTQGQYDPLKRLKNGDVISSSSNVTLNGYVYGDVMTGGANITPSSRISGTINNDSSVNLPTIKSPSWSANTVTPNSITGTTTVSAGTIWAPALVKVSSISGTLKVNRGFFGLATDISIWVTGDITGSIQIPSGVNAKVYVGGNINVGSGALVNASGVANSFQIFGVAGSSGLGTRQIQITLGNLAAAIYAPSHQITLLGNGSFSGAIAGASFASSDGVQIHFDEALALNVGPVLGYTIANSSNAVSRRRR